MALFLSRLHPKKGLERLIPAWRKLAAKMPEAVLVIAGTGEAEHVAGIDRLIDEHGLEKQVIRVGQLTGQKKWEALVDADVFVLPSHQEGFSMAITEALAAGCPAVVTEECNFDELEDARGGNCGVIIRNGDMAGFVEAVESLLKASAARAAMGARGAALVRGRYTWEKIAGDLEKAYQHVLAGKRFTVAGDDSWR